MTRTCAPAAALHLCTWGACRWPHHLHPAHDPACLSHTSPSHLIRGRIARITPPHLIHAAGRCEGPGARRRTADRSHLAVASAQEPHVDGTPPRRRRQCRQRSLELALRAL